jgi:hypothetical protein
MMRAKVRKLPPCGDTFTNTPNNIFQGYASSSEYGVKLLLTASASLKRIFLRDYLIIFMIAVLVLALTSWIALIIKCPVTTEIRWIFIRALITPGDKGIVNRACWLSTPKARIARPNCNDSRIRVPTVCRYCN